MLISHFLHNHDNRFAGLKAYHYIDFIMIYHTYSWLKGAEMKSVRRTEIERKDLLFIPTPSTPYLWDPELEFGIKNRKMSERQHALRSPVIFGELRRAKLSGATAFQGSVSHPPFLFC